MVSVELQLQNPSGLHLRPAGILCKAATKFQSHITITTADGTEANAKSVLSVLSACVKSGDMITLSCDGNDENAALKNWNWLSENDSKNYKSVSGKPIRIGAEIKMIGSSII